MKESAGLVEDIYLMADKGVPLDTKRIRTLATRIMEQIRRTDSIVDTMNKFAHSMDETKQQIDICNLLAQVASLSERLFSIRGITLTVKTDVKPVKVTTNPFVLQNLVWLCLNFAMDVTGEAKTVSIAAETWGNGGRIRFTGLKELSGIPAGSFPAEKEKALKDVLCAEITTDVEHEELLLILPDEIVA
jgi:C4-dicarboxylate-specific signal transduction histidine kinase